MIDSECCQVNDKLRRLAAVLPDVASLSPLDYDCTSKRADIDVLQTLVESAKKLKVSKTSTCTKYILFHVHDLWFSASDIHGW